MSLFEELYLAANPDVAAAVRDGMFANGMQHYLAFGKTEGRPLVPTSLPPRHLDDAMASAKLRKLQAIAPLLRTDLAMTETEFHYDFLSAELRARFAIEDGGPASGNDYDPHVLDLIARHRHGLVLDCGAGDRRIYHDNVVNFDIAAFDSTDVRGVAEVLPFVDGAFDAVLLLAVLEHVADPIRCAAEIKRVLKPGGELICCAAFMQPYHGYPHHYFNMSHDGLASLFADAIEIERIAVYDSVRPIWSLSWIVNSWAGGLAGKTREDFLDMRLRDFLESPSKYLQAPFVSTLSDERNRELASANVLFGRKKARPHGLPAGTSA